MKGKKVMLSNVLLTKSCMLCASLIILLSGSLLAFGQKSCECGEPSLGTVTCEDDQEPFCIVKAGKVHGRCRSRGKRTGSGLDMWVLSQALGRPVSESELKDPEVQES